MKEIILSIRSVDDIKSNHIGLSDAEKDRIGWDLCSSYEGFILGTSKRTILFLIHNEQNCCEAFGHITSEDDLDSFIGAEILNIERVDDKLKNYEVLEDDFDEASAIFLNVHTNKGVLQFVVYNTHNGYYGHNVLIKIEELESEGL